MRLSVKTLVAVGAVVLLGAGRSYADTVTFNNSALNPSGTGTITSGAGGTISLSAGAADTVARILPTNGFAITGSCGISGTSACLNLSSGPFLGAIGFTPANDYAYAGLGSSVTVVGGVPLLGIPNGTPLFTTTFDGAVKVTFDDLCPANPVAADQCTADIEGTLAPGLLNTVLATALGVSPATLGGNDGDLLVRFIGNTGLVSGSPSGTSMGNTNQLEVVTPGLAVSAVPEPGSLILLGTGLVTAARFISRRRRAL